MEEGATGGGSIVIFEERPEGTIWISKEDFESRRAAVEADVDDRMGWRRYAPLLRERGFKLREEQPAEKGLLDRLLGR